MHILKVLPKNNLACLPETNFTPMKVFDLINIYLQIEFCKIELSLHFTVNPTDHTDISTLHSLLALIDISL